MPIKAKSKSAANKSASRKTAKKTTAKKTIGKKSAVINVLEKRPIKKKAVVKKKALGVKPFKKNVKKSSVKTNRAAPSTLFAIEPGPPPQGLPPVEEPSRHEEAIGTVTHYYSHLGVAIVQINKGRLKTGDTVHIKGHSADFSQPVESMEYEHLHIDQAEAGQNIGLRVKDHTREHDIVYLVK
jgi:putative protease